MAEILKEGEGVLQEGESDLMLNHKAGHLAWCALMALALVRKDGGIQSAAQENLFLTRWLATALKQRCFSRDVTPDIEWLLKEGRQFGVNAKLVSKLSYLWNFCSGDLAEQSDLFRLTYALDTAKDMQWQYRMLSEREWSGRYAIVLNPSVNGIYLNRENLEKAFDDHGRHIDLLWVQLTGRVDGLMKLLNRCSWRAKLSSEGTQPHLYNLTTISLT